MHCGLIRQCFQTWFLALYMSLLSLSWSCFSPCYILGWFLYMDFPFSRGSQDYIAILCFLEPFASESSTLRVSVLILLPVIYLKS